MLDRKGRERARRLRSSGKSPREIARLVGASDGTVHSTVKASNPPLPGSMGFLARRLLIPGSNPGAASSRSCKYLIYLDVVLCEIAFERPRTTRGPRRTEFVSGMPTSEKA